MPHNYLLGIDLGGTKIEAAIIDSKTMQPLDKLRTPTEGDKGYEVIMENITRLIREISTKNNIEFSHVGIATPGTLDPDTNTMKNCNTTALNGMPLKTDLENMLGMEVRISNDANCFAIAEAEMGIVKEVVPNANVVFGVIMGTGVGGGLVVNGKVIGGVHGIGGEWGHNFLDASGGICYCGKLGCVETVISGPATEKYYHQISGIKKSLKEIVEDFRNNANEEAIETMERLFDNFGKALSVIINIIDPDAIVIGGGVGNIDELYTLGVEKLKKHIFNPVLKTPILKPKLGDSAGVYGAALL